MAATSRAKAGSPSARPSRASNRRTFTAFLPLFRRAFSHLDRMQRRRLLDALFARRAELSAGREPDPAGAAVWPEHLARLSAILRGGAS
jgi:hypothetical protein